MCVIAEIEDAFPTLLLWPIPPVVEESDEDEESDEELDEESDEEDQPDDDESYYLPPDFKDLEMLLCVRPFEFDNYYYIEGWEFRSLDGSTWCIEKDSLCLRLTPVEFESGLPVEFIFLGVKWRVDPVWPRKTIRGVWDE
jgi:hypothetical protein